MLLERSGEIVSREELQQKIWGHSTFVEFDQGLNYCVRQIRRALSDSASKSKYIETLPRQGYRFIASIQVQPTAEGQPTGPRAPNQGEAPTRSEGESAEPQIGSPFRLTRRRAIGVATLGALAGAGGWLASRFIPHRSPHPVRVVIDLPEGTAAADPGRLLGPPVVSPNGDLLVVTLQNPTGTCLYVRPMDADRLILLEGTEGASFPFWSPDNRKIAFFAGEKLKYVPAQGGSATIICPAPQGRGGAWNQNGTVLLSAVHGNQRNFQQILQVAESGGTPRPLTFLDTKSGENSHRYPQILPDGNQFLYFSRSDNLDIRGIYLTSIDQSDRRKRLSVADGWFAVGSTGRSGATYLLSQQAGKLVAQRLNIQRGELTGNYQVLMEHTASFSASNAGILVARTEEQELSQLCLRDRSGREIKKLDPPGDYWSVRVSRDDRFIAAIRHSFLNGEFTGWILPSDKPYFELASPSRHVKSPFWLSDSRTVLYTDIRRRCLLCRTIDPKGEEKILLSLTEGVEVKDISPSRECVVAQLYNAPTERQLAWSNVSASGTTSAQWQTINASGPGELQPTFSPDGKWLAFCSHDDRDLQIYMTSFPDLKQRLRVSQEGGFSPCWRRDGKELFYLSLDGHLVATDTSGQKGRNERKFSRLFATNTRLARNAGPLYDVSSDGQRFLLIESGSQMTEARIEILLNWPALMPE